MQRLLARLIASDALTLDGARAVLTEAAADLSKSTLTSRPEAAALVRKLLQEIENTNKSAG